MGHQHGLTKKTLFNQFTEARFYIECHCVILINLAVGTLLRIFTDNSFSPGSCRRQRGSCYTILAYEAELKEGT